jgi:hypothetical protein
MSDIEDKKPKKQGPVLKFSAANEQAAEILEKSGQFMRVKEDSLEFIDLKGLVGKEQTKKKPIVPRLSYTEDPRISDNFSGIKNKRKLIPDEVIKEIRTSSHLIASILRARGNTMSMFGHIKANRFDVGIEVKIKPSFEKELTLEQLNKVQERISRFEDLLINCGHTEGVAQKDRMTLPTFLDLTTRNMVSFGRAGVEVVYDEENYHEEVGKFHRFRPVDIGTIHRTIQLAQKEAEGVRKMSERELSKQQDAEVKVPIDLSETYPWCQMMDGQKRQFFSDKEMLVYQLYPSTDIEHNGYPVTPIDTAISSITTHMSIEAYNKLFFQNGRAAKGMLVISSDEIDQDTIDNIRQEYNASINDVSNSFRTPIIGISKEDQITWQPVQSDGKDGEFQFLYDQIARNILSSFNMSPDELPGYSHLSRSVNQQSLSESNSEWKLTAARDTGIRPLILKMQDFFNEMLFPVIDPELSQLCYIEFSGLDAQSRDQEAVRLQQESALHMTQNEIQTIVDKDQYPASVCGDFPLSERYQLLLDKYNTVGEAIAAFNRDPSSQIDPLLKYKRDGFFLQNLQLMLQVSPETVKALYSVSELQMEIFKMEIEDYLEEIGED